MKGRRTWECDIHPLGSKLAAKLIVFSCRADLRWFWMRALGRSDLGRYCAGAVNSLANFVHDQDSPRMKRVEVDRRYFCVIGLTRTMLSMNVVCHEAVHAAFCFALRSEQRYLGRIGDFHEERIAYPAGEIAAAINRFCHRHKLYQAKQMEAVT